MVERLGVAYHWTDSQTFQKAITGEGYLVCLGPNQWVTELILVYGQEEIFLRTLILSLEKQDIKVLRFLLF